MPVHSLAQDYADAVVRVRYAETDQMGVVYHSNHFIWFEVGRVELCRHLGFDYRDLEDREDTFLVVAEAHCRYKRPARFDDVLAVRSWVTQSQRRTVKFAYEIRNQASGEVIATGGTTHVVCDRLGRPKSLPANFRKYFPVNHEPAPEEASL